MRPYLIYAVLAGVAWGVGGYYEKLGLRELSMPPIIGIALRTAVALLVLGLISMPAWRGFTPAAGHTSAWWMIGIGGGIVAGSLGMWSFYASLSHSENLGVTLAIAFALAPIAGTVVGLIRGDQPFELKTTLGMLAIIGGIVLVQLERAGAK